MKAILKLATAAILLCSAPLSANESKPSITTTEKDLRIKLVHLQDSQGLKYVGGLIEAKNLTLYLAQMKNLTKTNFANYRTNQAKRDHGEYHMTLINPYEYQEIKQSKVNIGDTLTITLKGLGRVAKKNKETYFVVVQSSEAQLHRQQLGLADKDFHITLGFKPVDVYGVSKGIERLVSK
ncbi:MAG: hypothetical protein GY928_14280 [Colwellia sp.]|nr:hypothetical protein [Colwellia sp.]